ncbi:unnamed protein product [Rhizoctonia solani]|uniref:Nuclear fusion protein KAR5 n=1 Tax=Rhizoctonia solani TaxID=456999 RepID=A0A8H3BIB6_9AGAM|nr:unnamed protein product [Rhizoctonia solani]
MSARWIIIIWAMFLPSVLCLWRKNTGDISSLSASGDRRNSSPGRSGYGDLGTINKQSSLLKYHSERSDCFRDASLLLHSSCESLNFDPSERVKVAVEMTLCELATAEQVSLPLECKSIHTASSHQSVSQCVEALARSAQHWSSYSGYLREIPQLCNAYRRLHEIDHAKSIYANITNEKMVFLSSLDAHQSELSLRQKELAGLTEIRARVAALSESILADTRALNSHALTNAQASFSLTATNTQTGIETAIRSLDVVTLAWNSQLVVFNQRLDVMWEETFARKLALEQAIDGMRDRVSQTDAQLELQLAATQRLQTLSSETSASIKQANSQLLSASNMLSEELGTLASVTQELQRNMTRLPDLMFKFNSAWLPGIFNPLSSIWNG